MTEVLEEIALPWHASLAADVVRRLGGDTTHGLSSAQVLERRDRDGPNRRDGRMGTVDASALVAGHVVTVEAGDRVPADGRLLTSVGLEVAESALTGEAQPVSKSADASVEAAAALGDRATAVFMNTTVTRGRGEFVVTATGMRTEIGAIAHLLHEAEPEPTPLQRKIGGLGRTLAVLAGVVVVVVFGLGLVRGLDVVCCSSARSRSPSP